MANKVKDKNKKQKRKKGKKFVYKNPSEALPQKVNPFEVMARKKQTKQGKQYDNLKTEYQQRFSSNSFVDRRIGEYSKNLTQEDKMKLRFKAQQMVYHLYITPQINLKNKKKKFLLGDDDEKDNAINTFKGGNIDEIDINESFEQSDDEAYDGLDVIQEYEQGNNSKLSRKEIMQNIINKSKLYKLEKQKLKNDNKNKIDILDDNFTEISSLLKKRERTFTKFNDNYDRFASAFEHTAKTHPTVSYYVIFRKG